MYLERQASSYTRSHKIVGGRTPVKRQSAVGSKAGTRGGKDQRVKNDRWKELLRLEKQEERTPSKAIKRPCSVNQVDFYGSFISKLLNDVGDSSPDKRLILQWKSRQYAEQQQKTSVPKIVRAKSPSVDSSNFRSFYISSLSILNQISILSMVVI